MDRLTFRNDCPGLDFDGQAEPCEPINCCDNYSSKAVNDIVDRLAAYEDKIRYLATDNLAEYNANCMRCIRNKYPVDRFSRAEAEAALGGGGDG